MKLEIDTASQTENARELTNEEIAQQAIDELEYLSLVAELNEKISARLTAKTKLEALGLTQIELEALGFKDLSA